MNVKLSRQAQLRLRAILADYRGRAPASTMLKIERRFARQLRGLSIVPEARPKLDLDGASVHTIRYGKCYGYKLVFTVRGESVVVLTIRHDREGPAALSADLT